MKIVLSWSGGKDSFLMLKHLLDAGGYEIAALVTAMLEDERAVVMHEVPEILIERQATALNLRWEPFYVPRNASNAVYEKAFTECLNRLQDVDGIAFGDLFLEDIRAYRETLFVKVGMQPLFPLWKLNSRELALEFIALGSKAITVCVDSRALDESFAGQLIDDRFLQRLPAGVDPCGENGEFHSFVFDGPQFAKPVTFTRGDTEKRDDFYFCQLIPD
ncbi:MAG: ATP-binding protein [Burkholderiales bacterium]